MPAYVRDPLGSFILADPAALIGRLEHAYAQDGFATQFSQQTRAWASTIPLLQAALAEAQSCRISVETWTVLLEYPLYRLRKRIDVVLLVDGIVVVVEIKIGEHAFNSIGMRQVEEYALDVRDFHAASHDLPILPVLWCPDAHAASPHYEPGLEQVAPVHRVGMAGLTELLLNLPPASAIDG